jgi:hypothetical protein
MPALLRKVNLRVQFMPRFENGQAVWPKHSAQNAVLTPALWQCDLIADLARALPAGTVCWHHWGKVNLHVQFMPLSEKRQAV